MDIWLVRWCQLELYHTWHDIQQGLTSGMPVKRQIIAVAALPSLYTAFIEVTVLVCANSHRCI